MDKYWYFENILKLRPDLKYKVPELSVTLSLMYKIKELEERILALEGAKRVD